MPYTMEQLQAAFQKAYDAGDVEASEEIGAALQEATRSGGFMSVPGTDQPMAEPMPGTEEFNHRMALNGPMADQNANPDALLNNSPWPDMSGLGVPPEPTFAGASGSPVGIGPVPGADESYNLPQARVQEAVQGASFGFGDELMGGAAGAQAGEEWGANAMQEMLGMKPTAPYRDPVEIANQATTDMRENLAGYEAERGPESMAINLLGSAPWMALGIGQAAKAPTLGSAALKSGKMGAGAGAISGFGYADEENPLDRLDDTAMGAGIGGALGVAAPGVGALASRVVKGLTRPIQRAAQGKPMRRSPEEKADEFLNKALNKEEFRTAVADPTRPGLGLAELGQQGIIQSGGKKVTIQSLMDDAMTQKYKRSPELVNLLRSKPALKEVADEVLKEIVNDPNIPSDAATKAIKELFDPNIKPGALTSKWPTIRDAEFRGLDRIRTKLSERVRTEEGKNLKPLLQVFETELGKVNPKYGEAIGQQARASRIVDAARSAAGNPKAEMGLTDVLHMLARAAGMAHGNVGRAGRAASWATEKMKGASDAKKQALIKRLSSDDLDEQLKVLEEIMQLKG